MTNFKYFCVALSDTEKKRLKDLFWDCISLQYLGGWKIYCDHCTLSTNLHKNWEAVKGYLSILEGHKVSFKVIGFGISPYALAAMVDLPSENEMSHITLAIAPGHKPVESNNIKDWFIFEDEQPVFTGTVERR